MAVLESDGRIRWANAAQPYPMVKQGEEVFEFKQDGEFPLGMMASMQYSDWELELKPGDMVVFYTDGIIEAENEAEEMYGTERLLNLVTSIGPAASAEDVIEAILKDVSQFVGNAEQYDDMTVVVLEKV